MPGSCLIGSVSSTSFSELLSHWACHGSRKSEINKSSLIHHKSSRGSASLRRLFSQDDLSYKNLQILYGRSRLIRKSSIDVISRDFHHLSSLNWYYLSNKNSLLSGIFSSADEIALAEFDDRKMRGLSIDNQFVHVFIFFFTPVRERDRHRLSQ